VKFHADPQRNRQAGAKKLHPPDKPLTGGVIDHFGDPRGHLRHGDTFLLLRGDLPRLLSSNEDLKIWFPIFATDPITDA
jgi:hypothetical protein